MKLYTQTYTLSNPAEKRFWTAPHSDIAVGVKVEDALSSQTLTLIGPDGSTLTPEEDKVAGFQIYKMKTGDTGSDTYTLSVSNVPETFKLVRITTDSTVFETDEAAGPDTATKTWVNEQLSDYAETSDLSAYALSSDVKNSMITITQGGVTKGSFTLNQGTDLSVNLDAGGGGEQWTQVTWSGTLPGNPSVADHTELLINYFDQEGLHDNVEVRLPDFDIGTGDHDWTVKLILGKDIAEKTYRPVFVAHAPAKGEFGTPSKWTFDPANVNRSLIDVAGGWDYAQWIYMTIHYRVGASQPIFEQMMVTSTALEGDYEEEE